MSSVPSSGWEIFLDRAFAVPMRLVWKAWTETSHLRKWFCPKDFEVTFVEVDLRVGGKWRSGMRSPDGTNYAMSGTYLEIDPPDRLVFSHSWEDNLEPGHVPGHEAIIEISLHEFEGMTRMSFKVTGLESEAGRDGQQQGWSEALENLRAALMEIE
jgi:uncharacterized protein YndB with AHSA1/START domain